MHGLRQARLSRAATRLAGKGARRQHRTSPLRTAPLRSWIGSSWAAIQPRGRILTSSLRFRFESLVDLYLLLRKEIGQTATLPPEWGAAFDRMHDGVESGIRFHMGSRTGGCLFNVFNVHALYFIIWVLQMLSSCARCATQSPARYSYCCALFTGHSAAARNRSRQVRVRRAMKGRPS